MKKLIVFTLAAFALMGCKSTEDIKKRIAEAQATAVTICKYEPTISTITRIVTANQAATAIEIAGLICDAVNGNLPTTKLGSSQPHVTINGEKILIEGHFVK
jgi:hypothetical protein